MHRPCGKGGGILGFDISTYLSFPEGRMELREMDLRLMICLLTQKGRNMKWRGDSAPRRTAQETEEQKGEGDSHQQGMVAHTCIRSIWKDRGFQVSMGYRGRLHLKAKYKQNPQRQGLWWEPVCHPPETASLRPAWLRGSLSQTGNTPLQSHCPIFSLVLPGMTGVLSPRLISASFVLLQLTELPSSLFVCF